MFRRCSALSKAIINDDMGSVRKYIAKGWNLNNKDNMGWTPLHIAVEKQRANVVNLLLKQPNPPINEQDVEGNTCLMLACKIEDYNMEIVDNILRNKVDIDISNNMGTTAIHLVAKKSHEPLLRLLLKFGPNLNCQDYKEYTPLHHAVANDCEEAVQLLLQSGADANICEINGFNPLMLSFKYNMELAHLLIPYTHNLDAKTKDNWTALMFAVHKQNIGITEELINRGADIHARREEPTTLWLAIRRRDNTIFKLLWSKVNADIVSRDSNLLEAVHQYWLTYINVDNFETLFSRDDIYFNLPDIFKQFDECAPINADDEDESNLYDIFTVLLLSPSDNNINFVHLKKYYFSIIRSMLSRSKSVTSLDMKMFLHYFRRCPYVIELLDMVMQMSMPNITGDIVLFAVQDSFNYPLYLFQYCIELDKNSVFDILLRTMPVSAASLQAYVNMFTISLYWKQQFNTAFDTNNLTSSCHKLIREKLLNSGLEVDSLRELARDAVRKHLRRMCSTTKQFFNIVSELPVPLHVKDIIQCKIPPHHCK